MPDEQRGATLALRQARPGSDTAHHAGAISSDWTIGRRGPGGRAGGHSRRGGQVGRRWSRKPKTVGSIPTHACGREARRYEEGF